MYTSEKNEKEKFMEKSKKKAIYCPRNSFKKKVISNF